MYTVRSKRPGRSSASSREVARLVAATTSTCGGGGHGQGWVRASEQAGEWRKVGRGRNQHMQQLQQQYCHQQGARPSSSTIQYQQQYLVVPEEAVHLGQQLQQALLPLLGARVGGAVVARLADGVNLVWQGRRGGGQGRQAGRQKVSECRRR